MRFEITINGKQECIAGFRDYAVLSTTLTRVKRNPAHLNPDRDANIDLARHLKEDLRINVSGIDSNHENRAYGRHVYWLDQELNVGDEIIIRVLAPGEADEPKMEK